jgi:hypothetical protein
VLHHQPACCRRSLSLLSARRIWFVTRAPI